MHAAIIGYGGLGKLHAQNLGAIDGVMLAAVCDEQFTAHDDTYAHFGNGRPRADGFRVYADTASLHANEELDLIICALPTHLHAKYTIEALAHGCHVFCEKPFALTLAECEAVMRAAERSGRTVMIGHCMRFWPGWRELKDMVDAGRFGALRSISTHRRGPSPREGSWFFDRSKSGGVVMDLLIHDIDFLNFLIGEPDDIIALGTVDDANRIETVSSHFSYRGIAASLEAGWMGSVPFSMGYYAVFERAVVKFENGIMYRSDAASKEFMAAPLSEESGHGAELVYFIECIRNEEQTERCTLQDSYTTMRTALAVQHGVARTEIRMAPELSAGRMPEMRLASDFISE